MRILLILIFLFSNYSFSGELDGKGLECVIKNDKLVFWFENSKVYQVTVGQSLVGRLSNDTELIVVRGFKRKFEDKKIESELGKGMKYSLSNRSIEFMDGVPNFGIDYYIDRRTLLLTRRITGLGEMDKTTNHECEVVTSYERIVELVLEKIQLYRSGLKKNKI